MRFFIVKDENAAYYYAKHRGLCRKNLHSLHSGDEICNSATDGFALLRTRTTHIVCADKNNNILYINHPRKPHLLIPGKENIVPYDFTLTFNGRFMNLFYKTDYKDKVLLYHCILGDSGIPYAVAELNSDFPQYYCGYGKLFYNSAGGMLCSADADSCIKSVSELCNGGIMPCYAAYEGKSFLVYIKDGAIYLNKRPIAEDKYAESPLVFKSSNAFYIQWKSRDAVKYKRLENERWSDVIQCMGTDSQPHIINTVINTNNYPCYGYNGRPLVKI